MKSSYKTIKNVLFDKCVFIFTKCSVANYDIDILTTSTNILHQNVQYRGAQVTYTK